MSLRGILILVKIMSVNSMLQSDIDHHIEFGTGCLEDVMKKGFREQNQQENQTTLLTILMISNTTSSVRYIQENIIRKAHQMDLRQVEVLTDGKIKTFESFVGCLNITKTGDSNAKSICKRHFVPDLKPSFYLMLAENKADFYELFNILINLKHFNPHALYLVYIGHENMNNIEDVLRSMWFKAAISRAVVLAPDDVQTFITYQLNLSVTAPNVCGTSPTFKEMYKCVKGKMENTTKLFKTGLNRNYLKCSMPVVTMPYEPFVINQTHGVEMELLKIIGDKLNIHFEIIMNANMGTWGSKGNDSSWTGNLKLIYKDKFLGIGNIDTGMMDVSDFDFSRCYYMDSLVLVVPIARFIPKWRVLTAIFSTEIWTLCIGIIACAAVGLYLSSKIGTEIRNFKLFDSCLISCYRIIISSSVPTQPVSDLTRLVFISFTLFSVIISCAYTCYLVKYLKDPIREHQVSGIQEVIFDSRYGIGGVDRYREMFNRTESKDVFDKYQVAADENDTSLYWIKKVADSRNVATVSSRLYVNFLLFKKDNITNDSRGDPKIFVIRKQLLSYSISMMTRKGLPTLRKLDGVISKLVEGGLVRQISKKYMDKFARSAVSNNGDDTKRAITVDHLQGAFALLLIGYVMSFLGLIAECIVRIISDKIGKQAMPGNKINRSQI